MLRKIGALNFIEQFKYGALTIALPLYLISRGINVEEVGLVLSLLPLAFVMVRVVSAVLADAVGVKKFFLASSVLQVVTTLVYALAITPLQFAMGKISEGMGMAFFWAVDRTAIFARSKQKKYLTIMGVVRAFGAAVGILGAGILMAYSSFETLFAALAMLGIAGLVVSWRVRDLGATNPKPEWKSLFAIKGRELDFWHVSASILLVNVSFMLLFAFLLPVTMNMQLGMGYLEIAVMLAAFYVCIGAGSLISSRADVGKNALFFFQLVAIPLICMLPVSGQYFGAVLMLAGVGFGVCFGMNEAMMGYIGEKGNGMSSKIAMLIAPLNIASFVVLAGAGFALEAFGTEALFVFSAMLVLGFVALARKIANDFDGEKGAEKLMEHYPHEGPVGPQIKR